MNKTCTEIYKKTEPTIGDVVLKKALNLAKFSAERAMGEDWQEHPMHGIAVDTDKWAIEYQKELRELKQLLNIT